MASSSAQITDFPVVGPSNIQRSRAFDSEQSINCYPYYDEVNNSRAQYRYVGSKQELEFNVGANDFRGRPGGAICAGNDFAFFVIGDQVFRLDPNFVVTNIGTIATTTGQVSMSLSGQYLTIVDGTSKFAYHLTLGTFDPIPGAFGPNYTTEQNGFTLFNNVDTQELLQSAPNNPLSVNPLSTIQINYQSSVAYPLLAMQSVNGKILCFTSSFIETLIVPSSVTPGFLFRPDENLTYEYGAINATSIAKGTVGNTSQQQNSVVVFLCRNTDGAMKFMSTTGGPPSVISTRSIEFRINQLTAPEEAIGIMFTENGQTFYQVSWDTDNLTLAYNFNSGEWFDVQQDNNRHFAQAVCSFQGRTLATSSLDNGLYELSEKFNTNDDRPFPVIKVTKNMRLTGYKKTVGQLFRIWFEQGVGIPGNPNPGNSKFVPGANPEVYLSISFDGGVSYSDVKTGELGMVGERLWVTDFEDLGEGRDWTFKIELRSPTDFYMMGAQFTHQPSSGTQ